MKFPRTRLQPLAVAILALGATLSTSVLAQTTATTTPVGFITVTVPAAASATVPSNKAVSIPLYNAAAFVGLVASVDSANSFTMTGAAFTANQFTAVPHFVKIKTGAQVGRFFLVTGNTATQVTVDTRGATLSTLLAANDSCEIIPANTLGSVFGTTTPIVQTGATANVADNVYTWNGTGWDTYFHDGTNWKLSGTAGNFNSAVLYPDEGILITRRATSPLSLTAMGTVPSTAEKTDLGPGSTFIGNRFPVDVQLVNVGLQQTTGWRSGPTVGSADNVYVWNGSTLETYYYNGTNWKASGNLNIQDTTVIPAGAAILVTRAAATTAVLAQALPYTP